MSRPEPIKRPLSPIFETGRGAAYQAEAVAFLQGLPDESVDLVVTSPPYDGQPKYQKGEVYDRAWYQGKFLAVTAELLRVLKPDGNFVLNYRSRRYNKERGLIQYELVFWLRDQGWLFVEDFIWGKPSPPPGRFNQCLKDAVEVPLPIREVRFIPLLPGELPSAGTLGQERPRKAAPTPAEPRAGQ